MKTIKILVTGGGTSGHISPALAVIAALRDLAAQPHQSSQQWQPQFLYIGGKLGFEQKLVEAEGVPFVGIDTGKLRRYFSLRNFSDALRIPLGILQALAAVRRFAPDVTLATGGYVAVPPVIASRLLRVPILIHEQTTQIGLANRIASRCADSIALSYESALAELSPAARRKAFVTGNPVRPLIFCGDAGAGASFAGFHPDDAALPAIYVTGGSQGARILNRAVEGSMAALLQSCRIIHQCGRQPEGAEQDFDRLQTAVAALPPELRRRYFVVPFIGSEINDVFALADLVVGRAGAGTLAELCALGKPALYVPLEPTGGDEQNRNAAMCATAGAAIVIRQGDFNAERLLVAVRELVADKAKLKSMSAAALKLARPGAARELAGATLLLAGLNK